MISKLVTKYETLRISFYNGLEGELNRRSEEGWKLINMSTAYEGIQGNEQMYYYLVWSREEIE